MKKKNLLLGICLFAGCLILSGCNETNTGTTDTPSQGTVSDVQVNTETAINTPADGTSTEIAPALPTPTPEGSFVAFSADSGFYTSQFNVTLSCNVEGAQIYYTLDGSTPDNTDTLYEKPIQVKRKLYEKNVLSAQNDISAGNFYIPKDKQVDKGTVIRAIAYLPDGTTTPLTHATYFVGLDTEKYESLPVVSLITDFENLFDYETGIYVLGKTHDDWLAEDPANAGKESWQQVGNYSNRGREWEREVSVELIGANGTVGFKQNMGMRIMGGASRNQTQKSLKLLAREEYGAKNVKYELIPGNMKSNGSEILAKYKSFVLRCGGNDADFARIRDPLLQKLAENCRFETQECTPVLAFINGEFWGMYSLTEDYSDNYFGNNYDIDNKNVILVKRGEIEDGEEDDIHLFRDMYLFITKNDMSNPEFYEAACELVDMGSFIDYFAFELYVDNEDSFYENNNWRMWRVREEDPALEIADGRWRMAAYDTDFSTGIYNGADSASWDTFTEKLTASDEERKNNIEQYAPIELFRSLMENPQFKEELIIALCDMRNIHFEAKRAVGELNKMAEPYLEWMPTTYERFGPDWVAYNPEHTAQKIKDLSSYLTKRYVSVPNLMRKVFDLSNPVKLTLSTENTSLGTVKVNNAYPDLSSSYGGMYFKELTITLTAEPAEGCRFVGWESKNSVLEDASSATISFKMDNPMNIKAIFEKK